MKREINLDECKVFLSFNGGGYYPYSIEWEYAVKDFNFGGVYEGFSYKTLDAREYTIKAMERYIDEITEFIPTSMALDFLKTISDPNTGEELYNNLQRNVIYLINLGFKLIDTEYYDEFNDFAWGNHNRNYSGDNTFNLKPFNNNLAFLLKPQKEFVEKFKSSLINKPILYSMIFGNSDELISRQIKYYEEQLKYYKGCVKQYDTQIKEINNIIIKLKGEKEK